MFCFCFCFCFVFVFVFYHGQTVVDYVFKNVTKVISKWPLSTKVLFPHLTMVNDAFFHFTETSVIVNMRYHAIWIPILWWFFDVSLKKTRVKVKKKIMRSLLTKPEEKLYLVLLDGVRAVRASAQAKACSRLGWSPHCTCSCLGWCPHCPWYVEKD